MIRFFFCRTVRRKTAKIQLYPPRGCPCGSLFSFQINLSALPRPRRQAKDRKDREQRRESFFASRQKTVNDSGQKRESISAAVRRKAQSKKRKAKSAKQKARSEKRKAQSTKRKKNEKLPRSTCHPKKEKWKNFCAPLVIRKKEKAKKLLRSTCQPKKEKTKNFRAPHAVRRKSAP